MVTGRGPRFEREDGRRTDSFEEEQGWLLAKVQHLVEARRG